MPARFERTTYDGFGREVKREAGDKGAQTLLSFDASNEGTRGLGLDERAVEAVKKWRFRPAMRGSRAVPASAIVEVTFRLL